MIDIMNIFPCVYFCIPIAVKESDEVYHLGETNDVSLSLFYNTLVY